MTGVWLILQAAAITIVFTKGSIFEKLRDFGPEEPKGLVKFWRDLSNCPLCTGTWVGMVFAVLFAGFRGPVQVLGFGAVTGVAALLVSLCTGTWVGMVFAVLFADFRGSVQVLGFGAVTGVAALLIWRVIDALDAYANPGGTQEKLEE